LAECSCGSLYVAIVCTIRIWQDPKFVLDVNRKMAGVSAGKLPPSIRISLGEKAEPIDHDFADSSAQALRGLRLMP
jgi:hypothetical protein